MSLDFRTHAISSEQYDSMFFPTHKSSILKPWLIQEVSPGDPVIPSRSVYHGSRWNQASWLECWPFRWPLTLDLALHSQAQSLEDAS